MDEPETTSDPYHKWLGIPPAEQPPDHYRLLGIQLFESDPDVIESAADRQMAHIKTFTSGPHAAESQDILNKLSEARVCLLSEVAKRAYDAGLRQARSSIARDTRVESTSETGMPTVDAILPLPRESGIRLTDDPPNVRLRHDAKYPATRLAKRFRNGQRQSGKWAAAILVIVLLLGSLLAFFRMRVQQPTASKHQAPSSTLAGPRGKRRVLIKNLDRSDPQLNGTESRATEKQAVQDDPADISETPNTSSVVPTVETTLPAGVPKTPTTESLSLAIGPFNAQGARTLQVLWKVYLGVPVEFANSIGMKMVDAAAAMRVKACRLLGEWQSKADKDNVWQRTAQDVRRACECFQVGKDDLGIDLLEKAAKENPVAIEPDFLLGLIHALADHEPVDSRRHFQKCVDRLKELQDAGELLTNTDANKGICLNNLAIAKTREGKYWAALRDWREAIDLLEPDLVIASNIARFVELRDYPHLRIQSRTLQQAKDILSTDLKNADNSKFSQGWLYMRLEVRSAEPSDRVLDQNGSDQGKPKRTTREHERLLQDAIEDLVCVACNGRGGHSCPNRKCKRGRINAGKKTVEIGRTSQGPVTRFETVWKQCPMCKGLGQIRCPYCVDKPKNDLGMQPRDIVGRSRD